MARPTLTPPLGIVQRLAGALDEGVIALDGDDRIVFASGEQLTVLGVDSITPGTPLRTARTDYRLLRLIDTAVSGEVEERELATAGHELVVRAVRVDEDVVRTVILVQDVTHVRHLERVRADFVSNVSHELRTPVTAIRLLAETLESGGLDDREAAVNFVRRITVEATHMAQMLEELLELSTIESGLRPIVFERVQIGDLLTMVDRLRPLAEARNLSIEVRVAPSIPDISGDPGRLGQVLRNLLHNAIKFSHPGGHIAIEASAGDDRTVVLRVRDDGVGIAPADLPRVFERFWKADNARQRDGEGSGLGLAIVRHVVQAHGGTVEVESQPRRGTLFTVVLPAAA